MNAALTALVNSVNELRQDCRVAASSFPGATEFRVNDYVTPGGDQKFLSTKDIVAFLYRSVVIWDAALTITTEAILIHDGHGKMLADAVPCFKR